MDVSSYMLVLQVLLTGSPRQQLSVVGTLLGLMAVVGTLILALLTLASYSRYFNVTVRTLKKKIKSHLLDTQDRLVWVLPSPLPIPSFITAMISTLSHGYNRRIVFIVLVPAVLLLW